MSEEPDSQASVTFGSNNTFQDATVSVGDIVGRDKIVYASHDPYDVRLLRDQNPYLGLHSFTYQDRGKYAGHQASLREALGALTAPGGERILYVVTGASGSGKSSFVQAALLPALETHTAAQGLRLLWTVLRLGHDPFAALTGALRSLGAPLPLGTCLTAAQLSDSLPGLIRPGILPLLVIDQFEEVFTLAAPTDAAAVCALLGSLPAFADLPMHIILTMRFDFLPEAFAYPAFYTQIKQGLELRAMLPVELRAAIAQPLTMLLETLAWQHPDRARQIGIKQWEDALLDRLAQDASADPAYLPLLQVTLEDVFRRGSLTAGAYHSLADAIGEHAESVYRWSDYAGARQILRMPTEQQRILEVLLDLVEVSLDAAARRDIRCSRPLDDLTADDPVRAAMVETLIGARLLSTTQQASGDAIVVMIDIIHESLLRDWPRMAEAIRAARQRLQRRVRFDQALAEWRSNAEQDVYLLADVRLAEAQVLQRDRDVATQSGEAHRFIARSMTAHNAARQRQIRRAWRVAALLGMFAVLAIIAAGWAAQESRRADQARQDAENRTRVAEAQRLVTLAQAHLAADPELAVLLAREAALRIDNTDTDLMLRASLANRPWPSQPLTTTTFLQDVAFRSDGAFFLTDIIAPEGHAIQLWRRTGTLQLTLPAMPPPPSFNPNGECHRLGFDPQTNDLLTLTEDGVIQAWSMHGAALGRRLEQRTTPIACFAISGDGRIATINTDGIAELWPPQGGRSISLPPLDGRVTTLSLVPDGALITVTKAGTAHRWNPDGTHAYAYVQPFRGLMVKGVRSSADGAVTLLRSECGRISVWMGATQRRLIGDPAITDYTGCATQYEDAFFGPDDRSLILVSLMTRSIELATLDGDNPRLIQFTSIPYALQEVYQPFATQAVYPSADGTALVGIAYSVDVGSEFTIAKDIRLWTNLPAVMMPVRDQILDVAPDRAGLLVRTPAGALRLGTRAGQTRKTFAGHWDHARFLPGSDDILAWTSRRAEVWSPALQVPASVIEGPDPIRQVDASPRGGYLLVVRDRPTGGMATEVWSRAGTLLHTVPQPSVTSAATPTIQIDAAERVLLVADGSGIQRWHLDGETLREEPPIAADALRQIRLSPDGQAIALSMEHQGVALWRGGTTTLLSGTAGLGTISDLRWSPDSQTILIGAADGQVQLWTADGRREAAFQTDKPLRETRWSPDQSRVITMGATTQIWLRTGTLQSVAPPGGWDMSRAPKSEGTLRDLSLSPDGRTIAWIHQEPNGATAVTITDGDGRALQVLPFIWESPPQIRWHADSQSLDIIGASPAESVVMSVPVGRQALLDQVACTVTRSLTPAEQATLQVTPVASANQASCPVEPEGK